MFISKEISQDIWDQTAWSSGSVNFNGEVSKEKKSNLAK